MLLGAGVISEIGDWFNIVALISLPYGFGDGALGVGGMFAIRMLMRLIFQGPAGTFVDRHAESHVALHKSTGHGGHRQLFCPLGRGSRVVAALRAGHSARGGKLHRHIPPSWWS